MNTMKHHPTPSEELREACRRARTAVSDLSRATGGGLSRSDLEPSPDITTGARPPAGRSWRLPIRAGPLL